MPPVRPNKPLPTDPLEALGDSVFLSVLSHLPHTGLVAIAAVCKSWRAHSHSYKGAIWRAAAWQCGVKAEYIRMMLWSERGQHHTCDWENACKAALIEDRNRRFGRCRDNWGIKADRLGRLWRFRINESGRSFITTNQDFGVKITEKWSGHTVFFLTGIRPFAQVELCEGFVIFNPYKDQDTLHVFRTSYGLDRHERKHSSAHSLPSSAQSSVSTTDPWSPDWALAPEHWTERAEGDPKPPGRMPRDALAFDREIHPPTWCNVFRGRVDRAGRDDKRSVLGAAGEAGVYVWDLLDDCSEPEVYLFPEGSQVGVQALELDDAYIFVSGIQQLHVFDRKTKQYLLAVPPSPATLGDLCAAVYRADMGTAPVIPVTPAPQYEVSPVYQSSEGDVSEMGQMDIRGYQSADPRFSICQSGGSEALSTEGDMGWTSVGPTDEADSYTQHRGFLSCRHTNTGDLICATRAGHLLITRDYASVLVIPDPLERKKRWAEQTILVTLGEKIRLLETEEGHISFSTTKRIAFLHSTALPHLPLPTLSPPDTSIEIPSIRIHFALGVTEIEANSAICVDKLDGTFYYSYIAQGVGRPPLRSDQIVEGNRNQSGPGSWIRGWKFGVH